MEIKNNLTVTRGGERDNRGEKGGVKEHVQKDSWTRTMVGAGQGRAMGGNGDN